MFPVSAKNAAKNFRFRCTMWGSTTSENTETRFELLRFSVPTADTFTRSNPDSRWALWSEASHRD